MMDSLQIAKLVQVIVRKCRQLEDRLGRLNRKLRRFWAGSDDKDVPNKPSVFKPPSSGSELSLQYDDPETWLFGKLSNEDYAGVFDTDRGQVEGVTPLQLEVEADVEPVTEQPLHDNIQADEEPSRLQTAEPAREHEKPLYASSEDDKESLQKVEKRQKSSPKRRKESHHSHNHHHGRHHHGQHQRAGHAAEEESEEAKAREEHRSSSKNT